MTTLEDVLRSCPAVHDDELTGQPALFQILPDVLFWLQERVKPSWRTLETGAGISTILFALIGTEHACVVPNRNEVERITAYCLERHISTTRIKFQVAPSERFLPAVDVGPLDLVLIDGSHSFPVPFIDWFYTCTSLRVGGILVVDDTQVWTGRVLRDFLAGEPEWELTHEWDSRAVAFIKRQDYDVGKLWVKQPYVKELSARSDRSFPDHARRLYKLLRSGGFREVQQKLVNRLRRGVPGQGLTRMTRTQ